MRTIPPTSSEEAVNEKLTFFPVLTVNCAWSAGVGELQITFVVSLRAAGTRKRSAKAAAASATKNEEENARPANTFPLRVARNLKNEKGAPQGRSPVRVNRRPRFAPMTVLVVSRRSSRHRRLLSAPPRFGVVLALALVGLVWVGSSWGALTNTAQLDNGMCGRNLQLGSDKTASSSATPSFLLAGDGGLSSYQAFVDGAPVGVFYSDGYANELLPHPTYTITPFSFSVDTVPPAQPSTPVISGYSDSGLLGDHITMYRNVTFSGFADPNVSIQLYNGISL